MLAEPALRPSVRLDSHEAAVAYFMPVFAGLRRESLRVAYLDRERSLLGLGLLDSLRPDLVGFPLRTIIRDALQFGSSGLIVAHNHPSGDPLPSRDDLSATRALIEATRPLDIRVHDHLIFAGSEPGSLLAMGLL